MSLFSVLKVLKAQTEPFPVLVSRALADNGTLPFERRIWHVARAALHKCCTEAQDNAVDGSNVHVCVAHV